MAAIQLLVFLVHVMIVAGASVSYISSVCESSADCTGNNNCCRNQNGNLLVMDEDGGFLEGMQSGYCQFIVSKSGEICDDNCACETGYECYAQMSGIQQPKKCYNATWVQQQREYWENCDINPQCMVPP